MDSTSCAQGRYQLITLRRCTFDEGDDYERAFKTGAGAMINATAPEILGHLWN